MENEKLSYDQLLKLNDEQKNEIEFLKIQLAQFDAPDLSGRIKQKQADNLDKLQLAAKVAGLGYYEWFPQKNVFAWDPVMYEIFGLEPESKLDKNQYFFEVLHPDDKKRVNQGFNDSLDAKCRQQYFPAEYRIILPGGVLKHIQAYSLHFRDKDGELIRIIGSCQDITDRRKNEQKARESEMRYFELVDTISSGVAIYEVRNQGESGDDYIIRDFNRASLKIEGLKREDVVGKSLKDIRPNIDEYGLIPIFRKVWETGEPANFPAKVYTDDKYYNYYENRVYRLPNLEIVAIYDDVTEREIAFQKAKEAVNRFNLAMNAAKDGLYDWDLKTDVVYYSPGWKSMLGYEDHELENHFSVWEKLTDPKDAKESREMVQKLISKKIDRFELEFKMKHKNGHWVDILSRAEAVFDENGEAVKIVGTHIDISERKEYAKALSENQKLLKTIAENYPNSFISIINQDFTIGFSSGQEFKNQNLDPVSFVGLSVETVFGEHASLVKDYYQKTFEGAEQNFELFLNEQYQLYKTVPLPDADGDINRIMVVVENISEKRLTEIALKENEQKFRSLYQNSPFGITICKMLFDKKGRAIDFIHLEGNEATSANTGFEMNSLIGKKATEISDTAEITELIKKYEHVVKTGKPCSYNQYFDFYNRTLEVTVFHLHHDLFIINFIDISDRVNAEDAKKKSDEKYRLLANNSVEVIWQTDLKMNFTYVNPSIYKTFGYTPDEWIGTNLSKHATRKEFFKMARKALYSIKNYSKAKHVLFEANMLNKDGREIPVEISGQVLFNEAGLPVGVQGATRDISNRKKTEAALRKSEEQFRLMFENHNAVMMLIDPISGKIVNANRSAEKFYGYSLKQITSMAIDNINTLPKTEVATHRSKALGGQINHFQFRHRLKDGRIRDVEVYSTSNIFGGKEVLFSIVHDVTNKVFAEKALQKSEEKYRLLLNNQTDLIVKVDTEGRFLFVSPNYCKTFGKTEEELLGNQFIPLVHEDDRKSTQEEMKKLNHPPHTCVLQQRALTVDGWLWFEWVDTAVLDDDGKLLEIIGVGRDITDRKNAAKKLLDINEQLAAQNEEYELLNEELNESMDRIKKINDQLEISKEKAQESDRLKSAFLANMSHEIRTPMNGILGFADLLKEPDLTGEEQHKYIHIIEQSGKRMLNIINDLIDISKIEASQMEVKISEIVIKDQVDYLSTFFRPEMEKKGLRFTQNFPATQELLIFRTDREKLYAIITNLLKNAIKYTNEGSIEFGYSYYQDGNEVQTPDRDRSKIETHDRNENGVQTPDRASLQFYIKDTGIGIPANRTTAIFERFIQADIEDRNALEGAGLGLAICKAYVEMLGGKIWVESIENVGSTFYFTIPDHPIEDMTDTMEKTALIEDTKANENKIKILVAEDDETSEMHLSIILKDITEEVIYARTGKQAVEIIKQNPDIDLILMDIKMPEMDGIIATRKIRTFNRSVIIVAQTAYALTGDREKALEVGCNEYISKPISREKLFKLINSFSFTNKPTND